MTDKPCCKCGLLPRMLNRAGKPLTMCEQCQRAAWRGYKPAPKRQPKMPAPPKMKEPKPEQPKEPKPKKQPAERIQTELQRELIATRFELRRLRRLIASASSIDEIRGQL